MRTDRGVALLEVVAAVAILGIAALGFVEVTAAGLRATAAARDRERELADAERLLVAYTLLKRADLDLRLGDRTVGPYVVNVQRPEPELYRIAIGNLVTVVHHPERPDAP